MASIEQPIPSTQNLDESQPKATTTDGNKLTGTLQLPGESVGPSRLTFVLADEPELPATKKMFYFIYNPKEKTILGRSCCSWCCVLVYYIIFYFFIFSYFFASLFILIACSGTMVPLNTAKSYAMFVPPMLATANGLHIFPYAPKPKRFQTDVNLRVRTSTIFYDINDDNSIKVYSDLITQKLKEYKHQVTTPNCSVQNNFGYNEGEPCVILRFNKVFGWSPTPTIRLEKLVKEDGLEDTAHGIALNSYVNYLKGGGYSIADIKKLKETEVGVHCMGHDGVSSYMMGELSYYPQPSIPVKPYTLNADSAMDQKDKAKRWDWMPYILLKFNNPRRNVVIEVICKAMEETMDLAQAKDGLGAVHFSIFILDTK